MITKQQAATLQRKIAAARTAWVEYSWKGGKTPDQAVQLELTMVKTTVALDRYINKLTVKGT
jgi:hypothetical protein